MTDGADFVMNAAVWLNFEVNYAPAVDMKKDKYCGDSCALQHHTINTAKGMLS